MLKREYVSRHTLIRGSLALTAAGLLRLGATAEATTPRKTADETASMVSPEEISFRHVHLDFHTSPAITGVGKDLNAADPALPADRLRRRGRDRIHRLFCAPVFRTNARYAYAFDRDLVGHCLQKLLTKPMARAEGPSTMQATVTEQPNRRIMHLLNYSAERRGIDLDIVEDVIPLYNVKLALHADRRPQKVYLAPQRESLQFNYTGGYVETVVPVLTGHQMIVFEDA